MLLAIEANCPQLMKEEVTELTVKEAKDIGIMLYAAWPDIKEVLDGSVRDREEACDIPKEQ